MSSLTDRSQDIQAPGLEEPHPSPFPEPVDIPVLVDDVKHLGDFNMTRLTFFTIDATTAVVDCVSSLRERGVPFLLLGMSPVIHRPMLLSTTLFASSEHIDQLFNTIEDIEGLIVETAHIWLPNFLFEGGRSEWKLSPSGEESGAIRGAVWRLSLPLFRVALLFQREVIGAVGFAKQCRELVESPVAPLEYSPQETTAFRLWSAAQIDAARKNYLEQRKDPNRQVLDYVDEQGRLRAG
jgi:hypothetical protein